MAAGLHRRRKPLVRRSQRRWLEHASRYVSASVLALLVCCTSRPDGSGLFQAVGSPASADPLAPDTGGVDRGDPLSPGPPTAAGAGGREQQTVVIDLGPSGIGGQAGSGAIGTDPPEVDVDGFDAGVEDAAVGVPDARPPPTTTTPCFPEPELCDGLDSDCDGDVDGPTCPQGCSGFALDGRGYMFCSAAVTRAQGLERCAQEGMRLVWLETADESDAVTDAILATNPSVANNPELLTQIGASDGVTEGAWRWVGNRVAPDAFLFWQGGAEILGGEALGGAYASWSLNEPNNSSNEDCATIAVIGSALRPQGSWDDRACGATQAFPFACETP